MPQRFGRQNNAKKNKRCCKRSEDKIVQRRTKDSTKVRKTKQHKEEQEIPSQWFGRQIVKKKEQEVPQRFGR